MLNIEVLNFSRKLHRTLTSKFELRTPDSDSTRVSKFILIVHRPHRALHHPSWEPVVYFMELLL